jgi:uncharacterized SAM-binding protein YcdF (DUF218 family)
MADLILNVIKGQFSSLNFFILLVAVGIFFRWRDKKKTSNGFIVSAFLFLVIVSTGFIPRKLTGNMESKYPPFQSPRFDVGSDTFYIHVLGGGYTFDTNISPVGQLSWAMLGRVAEGISIANKYPNSILVFSGNVASGNQSMAMTGKKAAMQLGIDSTRIEILEAPATTQEEAAEFVKKFGTQVRVIVVTDAIHMPRAMKFFVHQGVYPFPAPANYLIKEDNSPIGTVWLPSIDNMMLMDRLFREWLGLIKGFLMS